MATIVGAVAASHTPTIGFAQDSHKQSDPVWAPIFEAFAPSRHWLAEQKPDALVVVYNDHISSFFLDHYSSFSLGVGQRWPLPIIPLEIAALYENQAQPAVAGELQRQRDKVALQTKGAEKLEGTYPYTLSRSVKALRLNRFLHAMVQPAHREAFLNDPETAFEQAALSDEERDLLRRRDWRGLIRYGAIFFVLEKLGAVLGVSNLHIYAAMKGLPLDAFLQTRNAPARCIRSRPCRPMRRSAPRLLARLLQINHLVHARPL